MFARSISSSWLAARARARTRLRRPESMFTSPVNSPGSTTLIGISPSQAGCTISRLPSIKTKMLGTDSLCSKSTSPAAALRCLPNGASRAICAASSLGNIDSLRSVGSGIDVPHAHLEAPQGRVVDRAKSLLVIRFRIGKSKSKVKSVSTREMCSYLDSGVSANEVQCATPRACCTFAF